MITILILAILMYLNLKPIQLSSANSITIEAKWLSRSSILIALVNSIIQSGICLTYQSYKTGEIDVPWLFPRLSGKFSEIYFSLPILMKYSLLHIRLNIENNCLSLSVESANDLKSTTGTNELNALQQSKQMNTIVHPWSIAWFHSW